MNLKTKLLYSFIISTIVFITVGVLVIVFTVLYNLFLGNYYLKGIYAWDNKWFILVGYFIYTFYLYLVMSFKIDK